MQDFHLSVSKINSAIKLFNLSLREEFATPLLPSDLLDKNHYCDIKNTPYDNQHWPNYDKPGVYFVFGRSLVNPNRTGVYIGKASLKEKMENRIKHKLFTPRRNESIYEWLHPSGEGYAFELLATISFSRGSNLKHFAPALEEFLISELCEKIILLNTNGNIHKYSNLETQFGSMAK